MLGITPKYRTDALACSCPGFWYRKTCRHYRAYCDAVSLVEAQDAVNKSYSHHTRKVCGYGESPIGAKYAGIGDTAPQTDAGQD